MNYSTPPAVSSINPALRAQVRAYIEKNGVARIKVDGPLATDKIKVERYLRKFGLTLDDLHAEYPKFWTLDDNVRGFLLGQFIGPVRRTAKRLKRMMARGYPADYDSRSREDRRRVGAVVRQRRARAKKVTAAAAARKTTPAVTLRAPRPIPFETVSREWCADRLASLTAWTAGSGPRQSHLRGHERELVKAVLRYQVLASELRRAPSHGELAAKIGCTRDVARNLVRRLETLYGGTGPWHRKA